MNARAHRLQHVLACLALFLALAVVPAIAATSAPKNSVTSKSIKNGQVKKKDIAQNAVTGGHVLDGSLTGAEIIDDSLTGADINESTLQLGGGGTPSGPAGGDLTGMYPNPQIAVAAVGTAKLADFAVTMPKLAEHAVTGDKVAHDSLTGVNIDESTFSTAPSGAAGGVLAGTYPDPSLNLSGGPCTNGYAVTNVSAQGSLTCSRGVFADLDSNVRAPGHFPALTTGEFNVAMGSLALNDNTIGGGNTAFGHATLANNVNGVRNTAIGQTALAYPTSSADNTAVGDHALAGDYYTGTMGNDNAAFGNDALAGNTGSNNTALGSGAGSLLSSGSNNIHIANQGVAGESNTIRIGAAQTRAFIDGIYGTTTPTDNAAPVLIDPAGQLGTVSSSRRYKEDIHAMGSASDPVMRLRPVTFRYRSGAGDLRYGLIAEQVAKVMPSLVAYGDDGLPETVMYQDLPVLLLNEVQRQERQNEALRVQVRRQGAQIDALRREVRSR